MRHEEAVRLLPWYASATLGGDERRELEGHLSGCAECAGELRALRVLGADVHKLSESVAVPPSTLAEVLRRIEDDGQRSPAAPAPPWLQPLKERALAAWQAWRESVPAPVRFALVAQLVVIGGLAALLTLRGPERPAFETAAGPPEARGARVAILVGFVDGVPEAVMRETLLRIRGEIVAGPSALGLYTVEVPLDPAQQPEKVLEALRSEREVIRFAAPKY